MTWTQMFGACAVVLGIAVMIVAGYALYLDLVPRELPEVCGFVLRGLTIPTTPRAPHHEAPGPSSATRRIAL
jgi:hypothetical protein